jgi:hypothetical protein
LLEQVQKTDAEVHIPLASPADKEAAASLGQALFTLDGARWFDQARFRTHFVLEPTDPLMAMVLGGALLGSSIAAGLFKVTVGADGVVIGKAG